MLLATRPGLAGIDAALAGAVSGSLEPGRDLGYTRTRPASEYAQLVDFLVQRGRREILERDLAELKQHVAALQSRIEEIEQRLGR